VTTYARHVSKLSCCCAPSMSIVRASGLPKCSGWRGGRLLHCVPSAARPTSAFSHPTTWPCSSLFDSRNYNFVRCLQPTNVTTPLICSHIGRLSRCPLLVRNRLMVVAASPTFYCSTVPPSYLVGDRSLMGHLVRLVIRPFS